MPDDHRCGHTKGRTHICGCDEPRSHRADKIGCQEFSPPVRVKVAQVDPHDVSSPFVRVEEMP